MPEPIQITTTFEDLTEAEAMASALIGLKLAACGQISTATSVYRWQGEVEKTEEYLLTLKTFDSFYPRIEEYISQNHSFDLPQITAVRIDPISEDYLKWMKEETTE